MSPMVFFRPPDESNKRSARRRRRGTDPTESESEIPLSGYGKAVSQANANGGRRGMQINAIGSLGFMMSWICDAYELVRYILQLLALTSILAGRNETAVEDIGDMSCSWMLIHLQVISARMADLTVAGCRSGCLSGHLGACLLESSVDVASLITCMKHYILMRRTSQRSFSVRISISKTPSYMPWIGMMHGPLIAYRRCRAVRSYTTRCLRKRGRHRFHGRRQRASQ